MEAVILTGIQGAGKSTFYERHFAPTHLRISLDLTGTKARERRLIEDCLQKGRDFVIDNTNATVAGRKIYIDAARAAGARVIGYFFPPDVKESLRRNAERTGKAKVPPSGIFGTLKRLQPPTYSEGFDQLFTVENTPDGFVVRERQRTDQTTPENPIDG